MNVSLGCDQGAAAVYGSWLMSLIEVRVVVGVLSPPLQVPWVREYDHMMNRARFLSPTSSNALEPAYRSL